MKKFAVFALVLSVGSGLSAADLKNAQPDLPAMRLTDMEIAAVLPPSGAVAAEPDKPAVPGPAKNALEGFSTKESGQPKQCLGLKLSEETKSAFPINFFGFDKDNGSMACYKATPSDLSKELSLKLCEGARDTSPAECYKNTPQDLDRERSVELCAGARNLAPANCYKATPADLSKDLTVKLCRKARTMGPADCYNKTPADLDRERSVELCAGAKNAGPADCYAATPGTLSKELSVKLCARAEDTGPAKCYLDTPNDWTMEESVRYCAERGDDDHYCADGDHGHGEHHGHDPRP